jgi:hypothetical protein
VSGGVSGGIVSGGTMSGGVSGEPVSGGSRGRQSVTNVRRERDAPWPPLACAPNVGT